MKPQSILFFLVAIFAFDTLMGQKTIPQKDSTVTYADEVVRTKLEKFESNHSYANMHKDSLRQKHALRIAKIGALIDTLEISDKRRERLRKELRKNPFSERLIRMVELADTGDF